MTHALAYTRVSTSEQAQEGVSLDAQEARIRAYCTLRGLTLADVYREEGVSGTVPLADRPVGQQLLAALAGGAAQVVIVTQLDRLGRSTIDLLQAINAWKDQGVALHMVDLGGNAVDTHSPFGRMFVTMLAALAELELGILKERVVNALAQVRAEGGRIGRLPLGLRRSDELDEHGRLRLEVDPEGLAVLRDVATWRGEGLTLQAIADRLNAAGRPTARGGRWFPSTVRSALLRSGVP